MTSEAKETKPCNWPRCDCRVVRNDPCPKDGSVRRVGDNGMNGESGEVLAQMRYAELIGRIREDVIALHRAAFNDDPFVYTACTRQAFFEVLSGMGRMGAFILSWLEQNPAGDFHLHSTSACFNSCSCEKCDKQTEAVLREIHQWGEKEIKRQLDLRAVLRAEAESPAEHKATLQ